MFEAIKIKMVPIGLEKVEAWADKRHWFVLKHIVKRWFIGNWNPGESWQEERGELR